MLTPIHVKLFVGLTVLALAADAAPSAGPVDAVGRLTLDGVLVAGVIALWRALQTKDAQLVSMTTKVTEVMTQVLEAVRELRASVNELRDESESGSHTRPSKAAGRG